MEEAATPYPGFLKRICFFFLFSYFLLNVSPFPLEDLYSSFARTFFSITELDAEFNGSGDKLYHYMQTFTHLLIASVLSLALVFVVRKHKVISVLVKIFYILIRYYLAFTMLGYGFLKVIYQQFSAPALFNLDQQVGEMSPMGLAWTYMGYSRAYTAFSGAAEMLGGLLLLFRSTSLIGATVVFAVMFNVMMMNFCYDIPVKIFSTHLVFWSFLLMFGFDRRLLNFILQRRAEPNVILPYFQRKELNMAVYVVKAFFFIGAGLQIFGYAAYSDDVPGPLRGIYNTQTCVVNGKLIYESDSTYWSKLIVDGRNFAIFKRKDGRGLRLRLETDTIEHTMNVKHLGKEDWKGLWNYELKDSVLTIRGNLNTDTLFVRLRQFDHNSFLLTSRGFHWVNEFPYNR